MPAMTLTEKIIARTSGKPSVKPGETVWVVPDVFMMYDWPGISDRYAYLLKNRFNIERIPVADRTVIFIDHMCPPIGEHETEFHHGTRRWANEQGIKLFEGLGIGHQVAAELGFATPGAMIAHLDTHVQLLGAFGALTFSLLADLLTALALGRFWIEVPATIRVELEGDFQSGVSGRDLIHKIIKDLGPDGGIGKVLEFVGDGARKMSIDSRMALLCQIMFCGAISGIFPADDKVLTYLKNRTGKEFETVVSDPDATYFETTRYDLSLLEPHVVKPSSPGNACALKEVEDLEVQQGYLGSCASGRLEDIEIAARILKGKKIKPGFRLYVVPSSREVMVQAMESGALAALVDAGAFVSSPTCDFCYGKTQSLCAGERAVSTGTLNVPGRMGSIYSEIYQTSAAVVAATALTGKITDPRNYL